LQREANNLPDVLESLVVGSPMWYSWLVNHSSFRFESATGTFTARKETRPGGSYWYAYRRSRGKLHNTYLGRSEELSYERLETTAHFLLQPNKGQANHWPQPSYQPKPMATSSFLATKITVPPLRNRFVPRSRLISFLSEKLRSEEAPLLTLLAAGAGYGKTTLLSSWAIQQAGPVAWLSLDESDNDPRQFWSYLIAALEQVWPGPGEMALNLLELPQPPLIATVLTSWLNALTSLPRRVVLVLDDCHFITCEAIYHDLAFVIEHLPPCLRIIIASRSDPPLPLPRWRVRHQLIELRAADLRFTYEEAADFVEKTMGIQLNPENIAALEERTEGWVAGLQLAALSLQNQPDQPAAIAAFGRDHRPLVDYLSEEVLERQPALLQDFLLQTAILERFNGSLAQAVTGLESRPILEQLEKANLFLVALDQRRQWYRYHHLFADFLLTQLHKIQPQLVPELHARASRWFEAQSMINEAIQHALAASQPDQAGQLIEQVALPMLLSGEFGRVEHWMASLPVATVEERPILLLIYAWLYLLRGQLDQAQSYISQAEAIIILGLEKATSAAQLDEWTTALLVAKATLATRSEDVAGTIRLTEQVLERLSPDDLSLRSVMGLDLGNAYLINGELRIGRQAFNQALATSRSDANLLLYLIVATRLCYLERESGRLQYAAQLQYQALAVVAERRGSDSVSPFPAVCMVYANMAALLYEWNRLSEAAHLIQESLELSHYFASPEMLAGCYLIQSYILQAQGQGVQARQALEQADYLRQQHRLQGKFANLIRAWDINLYLLHGQITQARFLANEVGLSVQQTPLYRCEDEQIGLARLLIAEGCFNEASMWLAKLERFAFEGEHIAKLFQIRLLQALLQAARANYEAALDLLQSLVIEAEPEGYVRLFVNEGLAAKQLLLKLQQSGRDYPTSYVSSLLAAFENTLLSAPRQLASGRLVKEGQLSELPAFPNLSEREKEVLGLLARGYPNATIVQQLVISPATLKSHLHRIYRKLQVSNRRQAVQQANKIGLLSQTAYPALE
jgi:LuxR family maltose regulon positive regulatory protein